MWIEKNFLLCDWSFDLTDEGKWKKEIKYLPKGWAEYARTS
jgi:hypothetical protein